MVSDLKKLQKSLYDTDYNLWLEATLKQLQAKNFDAIDWANLIEELASLGRSDKRAIKSLLTRLWEHLLKLVYWKSAKNYNENHWKREIRNFRQQIRDDLKTSPSLRPYLQEVFEECYQNSRKLVADISELPLDTFPTSPIANIEQILDENWLP